jgi:hypothetical protein
VWTDSRYGSLVGCYERGNEVFGSVKAEGFLSSWAIISFLMKTLVHGVSIVSPLWPKLESRDFHM